MQKKTPPPKLTKAQRASGIIATAIALIAILCTTLIVSPVGTPLRSEVRSVALPHFGQTWRVFAPNILKVDRTFEVRAAWYDDEGELVKSGWVNLTQIEQRTAEGNSFPSRIQKSNWNASNSYLNRYRKLDSDQQKRARDTFIRAVDGGFDAIPVEQLIEELGTDDGDVIRFLRFDYMMMRYSTLFATAGFDKPIERVQWRVTRHRPNDFTHRFDEEEQFRSSVTTFGWRQSIVERSPDVIDQYRALIERTDAQGAFEEAIRESE